jgi:hypothetical protein
MSDETPPQSASPGLSHGPARGYVWPSFREGEPGPALRHGAYSTLACGPRAAELASEIRQALPLYAPADEPSVRLLALALARVERASAALDEVDERLGSRRLAAYLAEGEERLDRLRRDLRAWIGTATKLMSELGMTPSSRARLGLDVALAQRASDQALDQLAAEGRQIRERRTS